MNGVEKHWLDGPHDVSVQMEGHLLSIRVEQNTPRDLLGVNISERA